MIISVIIPTYKPQAYLWECLNSLVAQTFPKSNFEIILVLNGCCEPYKSEIESYIIKHKDLNVHFIQTDTPGVSNARNIALDNAKGEYITFIDDDDYVSPFYLEGLYKVSSEDTIGLSYPYAFNDGEPEKQVPYRITETYNKLKPLGKIKYTRVRKLFSGPCMKLIPKSFIQDRRFDVRFKNGEDSLFMFLISDKYKYVLCSYENVIYYRRFRNNSATTSNRTRWQKIYNSLNIMKALSDIFFSNPLRYSFSFFMTRILGCVHSMFI